MKIDIIRKKEEQIMKKISIVSGCYNEEENVEELCSRVKAQMEKYKGKYEWEQILIDNCSTDSTAEKLREIASKDKRVKVIFNARNFGHIRSPYYGMLQASGDAVIYLASDLQDPPELIPQFIEEWEKGFKLVAGQKVASKESKFMYYVRTFFYWFMDHIIDDGSTHIRHFTGFGLFDKQMIDIMRSTEDTYPYVRGLVCDIGFERSIVPYTQNKRERGITTNNFYTLYDNAMIGIVKHSKVLLRWAVFSGVILGVMSILVFLISLINKSTFGLLVSGFLFISAIQLFFVGIVGEYVGAVYTRVNKRPLVVEKERINF